MKFEIQGVGRHILYAQIHAKKTRYIYRLFFGNVVLHETLLQCDRTSVAILLILQNLLQKNQLLNFI